MNIEKFNCFYKSSIHNYEMFLSSMKFNNDIFAQQEKTLKKVYYSSARLMNASLDVHDSWKLENSFSILGCIFSL